MMRCFLKILCFIDLHCVDTPSVAGLDSYQSTCIQNISSSSYITQVSSQQVILSSYKRHISVFEGDLFLREICFWWKPVFEGNPSSRETAVSDTQTTCPSSISMVVDSWPWTIIMVSHQILCPRHGQTSDIVSSPWSTIRYYVLTMVDHQILCSHHGDHQILCSHHGRLSDIVSSPWSTMVMKVSWNVAFNHRTVSLVGTKTQHDSDPSSQVPKTWERQDTVKIKNLHSLDIEKT